eukprot:6478026-Amphidinium_carterae.1
MTSSSQIRHNQGRDIAEWWRADILEHRPGPLAAKPKAALVTIAEAQQKIRDAAAKEELERKEREAAATIAAANGGDAAMLAADVAPDQAEAAQDDDEEEDEEEEQEGLTLPSQAGAAGSSKRKGPKGRGKSKGGGTKAKRAKTTSKSEPSGPSMLPRVSAAGQTEAVASSAARSVSGRSAAVPDKLANARKYVLELNLSETLMCQKNGVSVNNAQRGLDSMKKDSFNYEHSPEFIELNNHIQLEKDARLVSIKTLWITPHEQFLDILQRLWPRLQEVPSLWSQHVLWKYARMLPLNSTDEIEQWTVLCTPGNGEGFALRHEENRKTHCACSMVLCFTKSSGPKFRSDGGVQFGAIRFEDHAEAGRAYQRLVVNESIIPKMSDDCKDKVALMCSAMREKLSVLELPNFIFQTAVSQVADVCEFILILCGQSAHNERIVSTITDARTGAYSLIQQTVATNKFFSDALKKLRTQNVAIATHGPVVQRMQADLAAARSTKAGGHLGIAETVWKK